MGVNLIRLYDWEPRNNPLKFLDYCDSLNIKVSVSVSCYFVKPNEGLNLRNDRIPELINSFSNREKTDYHSAVIGIVIGNEPRINGYDAQNCIDFITSFCKYLGITISKLSRSANWPSSRFCKIWKSTEFYALDKIAIMYL